MNGEKDLLTNRYRLPTMVGLWGELLAFREAEEKLNMYKKLNGLLLVPKLKAMLKSVLEPTTLATAVDDLLFDRIYQILAPDVHSIVPAQNGLVLSGIIDDKQVETSNTFVDGCKVTVSPYNSPCKRNSFMLKSVEGKTGFINYGEEMFIELYRPHGLKPLYVQAESNTFDTFGDQIYTQLSDFPDVYCHFKILDRRPQMRHVSLGSKVVPNTSVIIKHVPSGRNLAVETSKWIPTYFGVECKVSCHTFQDKNRVETAENIWKIVGQKTATR